MKNIFICTLLAACAFAARINKGDLVDSEQPVDPKGPDAEKPFVADKPKPVDEQPVPEKPKGPDAELPIAADKPEPVDEKSEPEQSEDDYDEWLCTEYGYCEDYGDEDDDGGVYYGGYYYGDCRDWGYEEAEGCDVPENNDDDDDDDNYNYYGDYSEDDEDDEQPRDDEYYRKIYGEEWYERDQMWKMYREALGKFWLEDDSLPCFGTDPRLCKQEVAGKFDEDVEYCWMSVKEEGWCVAEEESCYMELKIGEQEFSGACYDVGLASREAFPDDEREPMRPRRTREEAA